MSPEILLTAKQRLEFTQYAQRQNTRKRRELRARELQDQMQRASSLNIIINDISIWNDYS